MPSVSKAQQAVMGQAWGLRKGLLKLKDINPKYKKEIKSIADGDMTDKELKKFASTKSSPLPHYVEDGKGYPEKPVKESIINEKTMMSDDIQHFEVGDKFIVRNLTNFPSWYPGFRGYEDLKVGDNVEITKIGKNLNGYVYFTDKDDQYGLTANDILIMHGKFEESSNHNDEKGIPVSGASSPIIGSKSIPNFTPGISVGGGIKPIVPYLNPDSTKPKGNRKLQNLADYREYIKKASK
jgi:hypothetical protein